VYFVVLVVVSVSYSLATLNAALTYTKHYSSSVMSVQFVTLYYSMYTSQNYIEKSF
jgi:hypothetical protein